MRTVITVSLNGIAYQLETAAYDQLDEYLRIAEQRLTTNPDRAEILSDLEQAIADKCNRRLDAHKNVVTTSEMADILQEMGPVDAGDSDTDSAADPAPSASNATSADSATFNDTGSNTPGSPATGTGTTGNTTGDPNNTDPSSSSGETSPGGTSTATGPTDADASNSTNPPPGPRPFYRIHEGQVIAGVCTGIAAYLGWHISVVRAIVIIFTIVTWGLLLLPYFALAMVVPYAETPQQQADAHGQPFTADDVIRRARAQYDAFQRRGGFNEDWKAQRRQFRAQRRQWRAQRRFWRHQAHWSAAAPHGAPAGSSPQPPHYPSTILSAVCVPVLGLLNGILTLSFVAALLLVMTRHGLPGLPLPGVPWWVALILLCVVYGLVASPLQHVRQVFHYLPATGASVALIGMTVWLCMLTAGAWFVWQHWPQVASLLQQACQGLQNFLETTTSAVSSKI